MKRPDDINRDEYGEEEEEEDFSLGVPWEELFELSQEEVIRLNDSPSATRDNIRDLLQRVLDIIDAEDAEEEDDPQMGLALTLYEIRALPEVEEKE